MNERGVEEGHRRTDRPPGPLEADRRRVAPLLRSAVWKRFRAACDKFFERKAAHFSDVDGQYEQNLVRKQVALLDEMAAADVKEGGFEMIKRVPAPLERDRFRAHQAVRTRSRKRYKDARRRRSSTALRGSERDRSMSPVPREGLGLQGVGRPPPAFGTRTPLQSGCSQLESGDRPPGEQHRLLRQVEEAPRRWWPTCVRRSSAPSEEMAVDDREGEADRQAGPGRK